MARKKKRINGWMLRKKGIHPRFTQASTVKVRDSRTSPNKDMPNFFDARRPPKAGRHYYYIEDPETGEARRKWEKRPHPWKEPIAHDPVEETVWSDPLLMVEQRREWLNKNRGGHGTETINYKTVATQGDFWEIRMYFSGMRQQFIEFWNGKIERVSIVYYQELADTVRMWERGRERAIRWRES